MRPSTQLRVLQSTKNPESVPTTKLMSPKVGTLDRSTLVENKIETFVHKMQDALAGKPLFTEEIEFSPNILFHGTSSLFEDKIDSSGLRYTTRAYNKNDLDFILASFEGIWWGGKANAGLPVLASYSREDFNRGDGSTKPVFLAETSARAGLYSIRDYAGGETARAIRAAVRDLTDYCSDLDVRLEALKDAWRSRVGSVKALLPSHLADQNLDQLELRSLHDVWIAVKDKLPASNAPEPASDIAWLYKRMPELRQIGDKAEALLKEHTHGIVYAVRLHEEDLEKMKWRSGGVAFVGEISNDQLIAKAVIDPGLDAMVARNSFSKCTEILLRKFANKAHLINRLSAHNA
jgi:hypothetical protein